MNNLRQIGLGIRLYSADYNGTILPLRPSTVWGIFWCTSIQPYLGKSLTPYETYSFQKCPSEKNHLRLGDYGANYPHVFQNYAPTPLSIFTRPAGVIMVGDGTYADTMGDWQMFCQAPGNTHAGPLDLPAGRHSGGGNFCFVDGHVEFFGPVRLARLRQPPTPDDEDYWGHFSR
jgi:prepilin-type processing-associated H-X9-DG protein